MCVCCTLLQTLTSILDAKCSAENFRFFLKEFHRAAGRSGEISKDQFFQVLNMPKNHITERVFQLFDIDSDGVLQFKEFMAGIALLYVPSLLYSLSLPLSLPLSLFR